MAHPPLAPLAEPARQTTNALGASSQQNAPHGPLARPAALQLVCWGTILFGAALVLMPGLARAGFGLLIWGDAAAIESWPAPARWYATLLHGVLGAVMVGWGVALLVALRTQPGRSPYAGWWVAAASVAAWYLPDTTLSLLMGAWQNALLNTAFAACFAAPLAAAWRSQSGTAA